MKKIVIIVATFTQIAFSSCDKNDLPATISSNSTIEQLFNDSATDFDGQFLFSEERSLATQTSTPEVLRTSGAFVNKQNSTTIDLNATLKLNNYVVQKNSSQYNGTFDTVKSASLVGADVIIASQTPNGQSDVDFSFEMYFPTTIHMNRSAYQPMGFDALGNMLFGTVLQENTYIEWNADSRNALGVMLFLEYNADAMENKALKDAGYNESISNYNVVVDNGSCSFDNELLEDIPNGAIVTLRVSRGNILSYSLPRNKAKKVRFVFATSETAKFKVSRAIK